MNVLIITGGFVDINFAKSFLKEKTYDYVIAADKGVEAALLLPLSINCIVGDFDSVDSDILKQIRKSNNCNLEWKQFPPEKDYTDTHLAYETALEKGATSVTILGATGTRFDHVLANIHLLTLFMKNSIDARIIDAHNAIYTIEQTTSLEKRKMYGNYLSLLAYTDQVHGITLQGFKYPLHDATLVKESSLGISNELLDEKGTIVLEEGILIVIESKD